jgi:hypothetical protein
MKHFQEVCEPYEFEKENASTGQIEVIKKLTDCINTERSLMKFVGQFLKQRDTNDDNDEDEDCDDDSSDDENTCENLNSELLA